MDALKLNSDALLSALNIQDSDKVLVVREDHLSDSNFVLTHITKQIFQDESKGLCLVILHNTIGHYHNVGKRLGYNLLEKIKDECVCVVEPLKTIVDDIGNKDGIFLIREGECIAKNLFLTVEESVRVMLKKMAGPIYIMVDDMSHLLDLGVEAVHVITLINNLVNLDERVNLIIGTHTSSPVDQVLCNALTYVSDVLVSVSSLKTGRSFYVTGVMNITGKNRSLDTYHFRAQDKGIKIFRPGESVHHLHLT